MTLAWLFSLTLARAAPPDGFTPVVSPFRSCGSHELLAPNTGYAHFFRALDTSAIAAIRRDVPNEVIAPIGFSLLPAPESAPERREREELTRLVVAQRRENLRRHARLTAHLRERCLIPLADTASWPETFPPGCAPDRGGDAYHRHLQALPAQVNAFRIYYALASATPTRIDRDLRPLNLESLPGLRAPLNDFELETAHRFQRERWMQILRELEREQATLLERLEAGFTPALTERVRRRLANVRAALELPADQALPIALTWSDPAWQSQLMRRWAAAKLEFYQIALGILEDARVVGLVRGPDLTVADLDQAYAHMQLNQADQGARLAGELTLDELLHYTLPMEEVLTRKPALCGAATALFYRHANATLRTQMGILVTFIGSAFVLPAPLVLIGGTVAAVHQMVRADRGVARTWNDLTSSHFSTDATAQTGELVGALDERLGTARAAVLAVAGLKFTGAAIRLRPFQNSPR